MIDELESFQQALKREYSPDVKITHSVPLQKLVDELGLNLNEFHRVGLRPLKAISLLGPKINFCEPVQQVIIIMMEERLKESLEQCFICCSHGSTDYITVFASRYEDGAITYLNKLKKLKAFL